MAVEDACYPRSTTFLSDGHGGWPLSTHGGDTLRTRIMGFLRYLTPRLCEPKHRCNLVCLGTATIGLYGYITPRKPPLGTNGEAPAYALPSRDLNLSLPARRPPHQPGSHPAPETTGSVTRWGSTSTPQTGGVYCSPGDWLGSREPPTVTIQWKMRTYSYS